MLSVKEFMTPEMVEKLQSAFVDFDDDGDGEVETQMLERALRAYGVNPTAQEMADILSDVSRYNTVDFNTFAYIIYHISRSSNTEDDLVEAFRLFDKDGMGKIKASQIKEILLHINRPFTDEQLDEITAGLQNDNGFVDYRELTKLLLAD